MGTSFIFPSGRAGRRRYLPPILCCHGMGVALHVPKVPVSTTCGLPMCTCISGLNHNWLRVSYRAAFGMNDGCCGDLAHVQSLVPR